jgi:hypothetical protein
MLTRWEETVYTEKDEYDRFPETFCLSIRSGFNHRPVVNEYIEMLWNMLRFIGYKGTRKKLEYEPILTHDVDQIFKYTNIYRLIRSLTGDLILRKKPKLILGTIKEYFQVRSGYKKDNYDTYDYLMDLSEKINVKSHFYFIPQQLSSKNKHLYSKYDFRYDIFDPAVNSIIKNIRKRGHFVGIHGSSNSFRNEHLLSVEINNLRQVAGEVSESRQHYLRFLPPVTWRIASENGLNQDSTLGFAEEVGFRCGICHPYKVFDFISRKPLDIIEMPLIVMEGAVLFLTRDPEEFYLQICSIIDIVKKYNGKFVFLWHTNCFNTFEWETYQKYYEKIVNYLEIHNAEGQVFN